MSLLLLLATPAASGSGDGNLQLNPDGNIILDADGNRVLGCCCGLVAPLRQCSDGAQFLIPIIDPPNEAWETCAADDTGAHYWWSNDYWACFYWDCAEKASGTDRGIVFLQELDPDCSDPMCDVDGDTNPDPPTLPPGPPDPDAVDCCSVANGKVYRVTFAGLGDCDCDPVSFAKYKGSAYSGTYRVAPANSANSCGSISLSRLHKVERFTDGSCGTSLGAASTTLTIRAEYNTFCPGQWFASITETGAVGSPFFGACVGDCTGGNAANANGCVGGSVTITEVPGLP